MMPWHQRVSDETYRLILEFEVGGSRSFYEKYLSRPTWPGLESGVTIGIGFDCAYHTRAEIVGDWGEAGLDELDTSRLADCTGIKRQPAKARALDLHDIVVPWEKAWWQFNERTIPRQIRNTLAVYPTSWQRLNADGFGALVSVVFNRGNSMGRQGDASWERRAQMRAIRDLIANTAFPQATLQKLIAQQIRAMIPLWEGTEDYNGMRRRRMAEAAVMEAGFV